MTPFSTADADVTDDGASVATRTPGSTGSDFGLRVVAGNELLVVTAGYATTAVFAGVAGLGAAATVIGDLTMW